jgi:hypothetical protein
VRKQQRVLVQDAGMTPFGRQVGNALAVEERTPFRLARRIERARGSSEMSTCPTRSGP